MLQHVRAVVAPHRSGDASLQVPTIQITACILEDVCSHSSDAAAERAHTATVDLCIRAKISESSGPLQVSKQRNSSVSFFIEKKN